MEQPGSSMMEEFCRFKAMCERLRVPWTRFDGGYMLYIPWNCVQGFEAYNYIYIYLFLHLGFHLENVWGNTEWLIDGFVYTI